MTNQIKRLKVESAILNDLPPTSLDDQFLYQPNGSKENFQRALKLLTESVTAMEGKLESVTTAWESYKSRMLNEGHEEPTEMPQDIKERYDTFKSRIAVRKLECEHVKQKIVQAKNRAGETELPKITKPLGSGKLRNGVLQTIDGLQVKPNADNVLCIADKRSKYNGMPVWQYRSQVVKAFTLEKNYRMRLEAKVAKSEGRPFKKVSNPPVPHYNQKTGTLEYPGYSNKVIQKLKK